MQEAMPNQELFEILGAVCNDALTREQGRRLDEMLHDSVDARCVYVDYMSMHSNLYWDNSASERTSILKLIGQDPSSWEMQGAQVGLGTGVDLETGVNSGSGWISRVGQIVGSPLPVAAAILGVSLIIGLTARALHQTTPASHQEGAQGVASVEGDPSPPSASLPMAVAPQMVAQITGTRNCLWRDTGWPIGYGSRLAAGRRLQLVRGLAEITFDDGAKVILEGPATFDVASSGESTLRRGRLTATVPERGIGFIVKTQQVRLVDYGTEFGVLADDSGMTEVHVFSGLVAANLLNEDGETIETVRLVSHQAARLSGPESSVTELPADIESFIRVLPPTSGPGAGLFVYEDFHYPTGPLAGQNGGFGWGGPWVDIAAGEGDATNGVALGGLNVRGVIHRGNHAVQTAQNNRARREVSTSSGGVLDRVGLIENQDGVRLVGRDGTTVYLSFVQRTSQVNDVFYGFEMHRGDGNANRVLCIGSDAEDSGYGVTSRYNGAGSDTYQSLGEENTEANLFVVKLVFGKNNSDTVEVYRNPESLTDESRCTIDAVLRGNFAFDRVSLGNFNGTKAHEVDRIRIGTNFRAVTGHRRGIGEGLMIRRPGVPITRRGDLQRLVSAPLGEET